MIDALLSPPSPEEVERERRRPSALKMETGGVVLGDRGVV